MRASYVRPIAGGQTANNLSSLAATGLTDDQRVRLEGLTEAAVDRGAFDLAGDLIAALDAADGDPDFEDDNPDGDPCEDQAGGEPWLAAGEDDPDADQEAWVHAVSHYDLEAQCDDEGDVSSALPAPGSAREVA